MRTISKKVLIVPIIFTIIGVVMIFTLGSLYYFMLIMIPTWLTMFFIFNRSIRKRASRVHVQYVCQICGEEFRGERCPRCGSRSKRAQF